MSEHTAGPWDFCRPHSKWRIYPRSAVNDGIDYFIAETFNVDGRHTEAKANAQLIAAAPDMLDALRESLVWLDGCLKCEAWDWDPQQKEAAVLAIEKARKAVSDATGGAS